MAPELDIWDGVASVGLDLDTLVVAEGPVGIGETWFAADTIFERQGRLVDGFTYERERQSDIEFEPGHPAYARMFERRDEVLLAWCLPRALPVTDLYQSATICVSRDEGERGYAYRGVVDESEPLRLPEIRSARDRVRNLPDFAPEPGVLPAAYHQALVYLGSEPGGIALMVRRQPTGATEPVEQRVLLGLQPDGAAYYRHQGGVWRLSVDAAGELVVETLGAPGTAEAYLTSVRDYMRFMGLRLGSLEWLRTQPLIPSYLEMSMNGFIPGETAVEAGLDLSGEPLAPALGALDGPAPERVGARLGHILADRVAVPLANGPVRADAVLVEDRMVAREAIVTTQTALLETGLELPPGRVLLAVEIGVDPARPDLFRGGLSRAWCDPSEDSATGSYACFVDRDGDGRLDQDVSMRPRERDFWLSLGTQLAPRDIEPFAYRPATSDERPAFTMGLAVCAPGDGEALPRLIRVFRDAAGVWQRGRARCGIGEVKDTETGAELVIESTRLAFEPGEGGWTYRVLEQPGPGAVVIGSSDREPERVEDILARRQETAEAEPEDATVDRTFRLDGAVTVTAGRMTDRAPFVRLPVAYIRTGTLDNAVQRGGWFAPDPLPEGTPLYGVTRASRLTGEVTIWCAPRRDDEGDWDTVCLLPVGNGIWQASGRAFVPPSRFTYAPEDRLRGPFTVTEDALDLGFTLEMRVSLLEWDRRDAEVRVELCAGAACQVVRQLSLDHTEEDVIELRSFGHHLRLTRPDGGDRHMADVEILSPAAEGYDAANYPSLIVQALQAVLD